MLETAPADPGPRVLVLTASMGAGHTEVAAELARRLRSAGARVEIVDVLAAAGPAGARLRSTYRRLLRWAPWLYDASMRFWLRFPAPLERLTAAQAQPFEDAIARASAGADVVVATYNLAAQCLGRLVASGRVAARSATVVIDPGPHPYWVSPAVELHLVPSRAVATALTRYGAQRTVVVGPLLRPEFTHPPARAAARIELGLPPRQRIVLLTAGSWAAGDVDATVRALRPRRAAAGTDDTLLVVLCGRDERLRDRLAGRAGVLAVGWTRSVAGYLAAADVVVDNAGGLTFAEALACGAPVVLYRPLPGHGRLNVAALTAAGLARRARSAADLRWLVSVPAPGAPAACVAEADASAPAPDAADEILALAARPVLHR